MSKGCARVRGSNVKVSIIPNTNCSAAPVLHQIEATVAAIIGATSITISLDAGFTPSSGAYTVASRYALVPGTIVRFGSQDVVITEPADNSGVYFITTTAQAVNVKPLTAAIAINDTATTYFAIPLCLKSANLTTNTTQVDDTTNCTGNLFTQINVGYMKMLDLAGFLTSQDYAYYILEQLGANLDSAFYVIDYDQRFLYGGVANLTDPSITDAVVKGLVGWTVQGQVQSVDFVYAGYLSAAQVTELATVRANYGLKPAKGVVTVA
jgi:hypothetical protein